MIMINFLYTILQKQNNKDNECKDVSNTTEPEHVLRTE